MRAAQIDIFSEVVMVLDINKIAWLFNNVNWLFQKASRYAAVHWM
jgi:hypothetical protein